MLRKHQISTAEENNGTFDDDLFAAIRKSSPTDPTEERKKYLLKKVLYRDITEPETRELADILSKDPAIRNSDEGIRALIMLGLGALGGYILAKMFQPELSCQR